jgi:hypothetical protein
MDKIVIKMPLYKQAMLQCEIEQAVWGSQAACGELLSKLLTSYYEYPILVTVQTNTDEIQSWNNYVTPTFYGV